jgi:hypothetical protein
LFSYYLVSLFVILNRLYSRRTATQQERAQKRTRIDRSREICKQLVQKFQHTPISIDEVRASMASTLLTKLPAVGDLHRVGKFLDSLCYSDDNDAYDLAAVIGAPLVLSADDGHGESMLHYPIDQLIRSPMIFFREQLGSSVLPVTIDRDVIDRTTTTKAKLCPDFLCWVGEVLLLKGKEKSLESEFDQACEELRVKMSTLDPIYFGDMSYMLCYSVGGKWIQFFALDKLKMLYPLTTKLDRTNMSDKISVINTVINIMRFIVTVKDILPKDILPLGRVFCKGCTSIAFLESSVKKSIREFKKHYPFADIKTLRDMYQVAIGKQGLVQALDQPKLKRDGTYEVVLATRGFRVLPKTEQELQHAIRDILYGLHALHKAGFVHRDIRWTNILHQQPEGYVLIDLEHGGLACEKPPFLQLTEWDDKTLEAGGIYSEASDIYQVGKLKNHLPGVMLSQIGMDFCNNLCQQRMSAEEALKHMWLQKFQKKEI